MTKENFALVYLSTGFLVCIGILIWYFRRARQEKESIANAKRRAGHYVVNNYSPDLKVVDLVKDGEGLSTVVFRLFPQHCTTEQLNLFWQGRQIKLEFDEFATGQQDIPVSRYERFLQVHFM